MAVQNLIKNNLAIDVWPLRSLNYFESSLDLDNLLVKTSNIVAGFLIIMSEVGNIAKL